MARTGIRLLETRRRGAGDPLYVYDLRCVAGKNAIQAHWHAEAEIIFADSAGTVEIDAATLRYEKGDILFINPEQLHKADAVTDGNLYVVLFPYDYLDFKHADRCQVDTLDQLKAGRLLFPARLTPADAAYGEIRRCVDELVAACFSGVPGRYLKIKSCLYDLLFQCVKGQVLRGAVAPPEAPQTNALSYVKAAIAYMEEYLEQPITMDVLAAQVGIHKNYLNRVFRRITGTTPVLYLRQLRLERSVLLQEEGATVTQAALASGFNNISYYIKTFKQVYGTSPGQYIHGRRAR